MQRVCFILRVRQDRLDAYREAHQTVWPEMLDALRETGWTNYSLFLSEEGLLMGYLETEDFSRAMDGMAGRDVNDRWQTQMAPYFEPMPGDRADVGLVVLPEVFHLD